MSGSRTGAAPLLLVLLLGVLTGIACSHATPRETPFYESWREVPADLKSELDGARTEAAHDAGSIENWGLLTPGWHHTG